MSDPDGSGACRWWPSPVTSQTDSERLWGRRTPATVRPRRVLSSLLRRCSQQQTTQCPRVLSKFRKRELKSVISCRRFSDVTTYYNIILNGMFGHTRYWSPRPCVLSSYNTGRDNNGYLDVILVYVWFTEWSIVLLPNIGVYSHTRSWESTFILVSLTEKLVR